MPDFLELLNATIAHLERRQADGVRFVNVEPATLNALDTKPTSRRKLPAQPSTPNPRGGDVTLQDLISPQSPSPAPAPVPTPLPASVAARWSRSAAATSMPRPKAIVPPVNTTPLPAPLDPAAKTAAMEELRRQALACTKCPHLAAARKTVVVGVGDIHARLMFIGEAPGADEDAQGEPFVGKAGELLTRIINAMSLSRSQVYIANILKCRPDTPGQTAGNRKPTAEEMATCIPWLQEQINLIQPAVMVALGATAVEGLLGKTIGITKLRGQWQNYRGLPLMPTYHPAYLLRNQAPSEKRKVWEDMLAVMERLGMPISEKQRGHFLTKS